MTHEMEHRQLHAFVDGELDLKSQLDVEERLASDPAARAEVDELRRLRESVRSNADYHPAPDALRRRLLGASAAQHADTPAAAPRDAASALRRWLAWRPLAWSFAGAALLALGLNAAWWRSMQDERLLDDVVASHVRSTVGQHLVDVASSDHHTVKPWLSSRLGFSPPVGALAIPGSTFLGGRVDYLDGRPVAALVYRQGEHVVNSFVWPTKAADDGPRFATERGFLTARWSRNGMAHWVVADVNREEFGTVVRAITALDTAP